MQIDYTNPTDNEIRRIVRDAADPISQIRILAQLTGKGTNKIREICYGIKVDASTVKGKKGRPSVWTDEKVQYLFDHPNDKIEDIAAHFGVSYNSVGTMRRRLGIVRESPWTDELEDKVTKAYRCGVKPAKISKMLDVEGITPYEVRKKVGYMKTLGKI